MENFLTGAIVIYLLVGAFGVFAKLLQAIAGQKPSGRERRKARENQIRFKDQT